MRDQRACRNGLLQKKSIFTGRRPVKAALLTGVFAVILCMIAGFGAVRTQAQTGTGSVRTQVIHTKNEDDFAKETSKLAKENQGLSVMSTGEIRPYSSCRLIVRVKDGKSADLTGYNASTVVESNYGVSILQFSSEEAAKEAAQKIAGLSSVSYVEPDDCTMNLGDTQITEIEAGGVDAEADGSSPYEGTADPFGFGDEDMTYASSVSASAAAVTTSRMSWGASYIQADQYAAYVKKNSSKTIKVAVVDSGVSSHTMLRGRLLAGKDFVDNDNDPTDRNGHGTHVAGIIVDCTPGIDVKILPVRVMNASGVGNPSVVGNGVRYAVNKGAKVINLSLGGYSHYKYLEECISYANRKGVTVVVAAGNGSDNTKRICPAHLSAPIVVAAINKNGKRAYFSNFGKSVDISAPGVGIRSCWKNGGYATADGTSMAAPHISAVAAMYRLMHPSYKPSKIEKLVKNYAKDLGTKGNDAYYGRGVPRMAAAIPAAQKKKTSKKASIDLDRPFALSGQLAPVYETGKITADMNSTVSPETDGTVLDAGHKPGESGNKESAVALDDDAQADFLESGKDTRKVYIYPCTLPGNAVIRDGSIVAGDRLALDVEIIPPSAEKVSLTWESSDPSVAAVDQDGVVEAAKEGSAEITVTLSGRSGRGVGTGELAGSGKFTVKVLSPSVLTGDAAYSADAENTVVDLHALVRLPGSLGADEEDDTEDVDEKADTGRSYEGAEKSEAHTGLINEPAEYVLAVLRDQETQLLLGAVDLSSDKMGKLHYHSEKTDGSFGQSTGGAVGMDLEQSLEVSAVSGLLEEPSLGKRTSDPGVLRTRHLSKDGGKVDLSLSLETGPLRGLAAAEADRGNNRKSGNRDSAAGKASWKCRLTVYRAEDFEERERAAAEGDDDLVGRIDGEAVCSCAFTLKLEAVLPAAEDKDSGTPAAEPAGDGTAADSADEHPAVRMENSESGSNEADVDKSANPEVPDSSEGTDSTEKAAGSEGTEGSEKANTSDTEPGKVEESTGKTEENRDQDKHQTPDDQTDDEAETEQGKQEEQNIGNASGKEDEKGPDKETEKGSGTGAVKSLDQNTGSYPEKNAAEETGNNSAVTKVQSLETE